MSFGTGRISEPAAAKVNLALHVRERGKDGRHRIETLFAFCVDGDVVHVEPDESGGLKIVGPLAGGLDCGPDNLVMRAHDALRARRPMMVGGAARMILDKRLPVAAGIGGGSADAAATLRLLTRLWHLDPGHSIEIAPTLGADVPACLLSMTARGDGAGDELVLVDGAEISGRPILLVNPGRALSTAKVFERWDGVDRGPLGDWREGRNDLQPAAATIIPEIAEVIGWLERCRGARFVRMSGSGATCFALFDDDAARDSAAAACPQAWWHLASYLR